MAGKLIEVSGSGDPELKDWDAASYFSMISGLEDDPEEEIFWDTPVLTQRGVLMADPGTKGTLTLLNLIAEEEAALNAELGEQVTSDFLKGNLYMPVRFARNISIAGDDHIAIGVESYLQNIADNHVKNNMVLSEQKHGISTFGAKFTEEYFLVTERTKYNPPRGDYESDIFVDHFKVALVSPETKPSQTPVNPSIGKGSALFKRIGWAPPGFERFGKLIVRPRFFARHKKFLPCVEGRYDRKVELPRALGGLGMGPFHFDEWDPEPGLTTIDPLHLAAIDSLLDDPESSTAIAKVLSRFCGDRYARGIKLEDSDKNTSVYSEFLEDLPSSSLQDLAPELVSMGHLKHIRQGYHHQKKAAAKAGYLSAVDVDKQIRELEVQKALITSTPHSEMDPATWETRYRRLAKSLSDLGVKPKVGVTPQTVAEKIKIYKNPDSLAKALKTELYVKSDLLIYIDQGQYVDLLAEVKANHPSMNLPQILKRDSAVSLSATSSELSGSGPSTPRQ